MQKVLRLAPITAIACLCAALSPQEKKPDVLELDTGRILKGKFESADQDTIHFRTSKGKLEVPREQALRLLFGRADDLGAPEGQGNPRAQAEAARRRNKRQPQPQGKTGETIVIPAGTPIAVRMEMQIHQDDPPGGPVSASVSSNVMRGGQIAIPVGSRVFGRVVETGRNIRLEFTEVNIWGKSYPIHTTTQAGVTRTRGDTRVAGGAAGAVIGHAVNGSRGAWRGFAIGRIASNQPMPREIVVEVDSTVEFRLNKPLRVTP